MQHPPLAIGVDIGGTHITCAAVQIADGKLLEHSVSRILYRHEDEADDLLQCWAQAFNNTLAQVDIADVDGFGIAIPGPFDYRNGISAMQHKFKSLYGVHIPEKLRPMLHAPATLPIRFINDATAFAVGEAWQGEGRHYQKVVVVTLGTGFGSAFIDEGVPVVTGDQVPKEGCLWHLPFKAGIADDYFSTRWFIREYQQRTGEKISGVKELMDKAVYSPEAEGLFLEFGQNLAECLAGPLQQFGAGVLIIGGNIAHAMPYFEMTLKYTLQLKQVVVRVVPSALLENATLTGSARLLDEMYWQKIAAHLPNI